MMWEIMGRILRITVQETLVIINSACKFDACDYQ